jgi:arylsulfatase A-like enzyme
MVGQVMDALERTGQADSTLVMVSSDNGALPGDRTLEDGEWVYHTYDHRSCGDWRGYKGHIWEGGHREPLVARWPEGIQAGSTCSDLCCLTDILPTCADLAGVALPEGAAEDGVSLAPALAGRPAPQPDRAVVHHSHLGVFAVRKGRWKCVFGTEGSGGWPPPRGHQANPGTRGQLYDIVADPAEEHNLWDERPDVVQALGQALNDRRRKG